MIGSNFLCFIDNYHGIRSDQLVRFMDDIYLFSNTEQAILDDFQLIQRLLGDKGLSVNPQKTARDRAGAAAIDRDIDAVKRQLLKRRRVILIEGYDEEGDPVKTEIMQKQPLTKAELEYIDGILKKADLEGDDTELILAITRQHASRLEKNCHTSSAITRI
jgi:hypothetical protein